MPRKTANKFSPEVRERAVLLVQDHALEYPSRWQPIPSITAEMCSSGRAPRGGAWNAGQVRRILAPLPVNSQA